MQWQNSVVLEEIYNSAYDIYFIRWNFSKEQSFWASRNLRNCGIHEQSQLLFVNNFETLDTWKILLFGSCSRRLSVFLHKYFSSEASKKRSELRFYSHFYGPQLSLRRFFPCLCLGGKCPWKRTDSIEHFIEEQAFSSTYDLAHLISPLHISLTDGRGVLKGWGRIWRRESLVLYKSFNTLWKRACS